MSEVERIPVSDDLDEWVKQLFSSGEEEEEEQPQAQPTEEPKQKGAKVEAEEEENELEQIKQQAQMAMLYMLQMRLEQIVNDAKREFFAENPHLKPFEDILEQLAAPKVHEAVSRAGKQLSLEDVDKIRAIIKQALGTVGKDLANRLNLSATSNLVGIPPSPTGGSVGGERTEMDEFASIKGMDIPVSEEIVTRIVPEDALVKWRQQVAKKVVEERIKDLRKRQQAWAEGYRPR